MHRLLKWVAGVTLLAAAALATSALAQNYPSKPIHVVVALGSGSGADILCRIFSSELSARLNQPIVVENKPGGSGIVGAGAVIKSPADGYTALCHTPGSFSRALVKDLPWDFLAVMDPVINVYKLGFFLAITGKLPVNNLQEFVAYAKANPGKLNYYYLGTLQKIGFALFAQRAGIDMVAVGYKGGEFLNDLYAGSVHAGLDGPATFRGGQLDSGQAKLLFVASDARSPLAPNVPTAAEAGLGDLQLPVGLGFWMPAGSPKEAIAKFNAEMNEAMKTPRMVETIRNTGGVPFGGSPEAYRRQTELELKIWAEAARIAKFEPQ